MQGACFALEILTMKITRKLWLGLFAVAAIVASAPAGAQQQQKPNILFIMGDDIGWMQPSIYHRGLMVGETPNIDCIISMKNDWKTIFSFDK